MAKDVNKIMEDRFQTLFEYDPKKGRINEFVVLPNTMDEEGDDTEQDPSADPNAGADPSAMGGDPAATGADPNAAAGADPMAGGDPSAMGGDPNAMGGDPAAMGADPNAAAGGDTAGATPPEGFNPQDTMAADPAAMGGADQPASDDDVIDISDFTDSQEKMEGDIEKIDNRFAKVMKAIGAFEELLRSNDEKIEDLKAEFERRNPTQVEKLGMQQANSYPFNVNPNDYWKEKEATSNYSTEPDNNGKEQGQYVITADDVNGDVNWKGIYDSLNDDFLYHQTLDKLVKI